MTRCVHEMEEGTCGICLHLEEVPKYVPIAEKRAAELFDFAVTNVRWTKSQACAALGCSEKLFENAVRELRRILSGDDINLVVTNEAGEYTYRLTGTLDDALPWANVRLRSVEGQLSTIRDVTSSIVNATSAKSKDGRKARLIQQQITILQLQLESLEN